MSEGESMTGVKDKNYNLVSVLYHSMDNVPLLSTFVQDAERDGDQEAAQFFRTVLDNNQKAVDQAKQMLLQRLS